MKTYVQKEFEKNATLIAARILQAIDLLETQPAMGTPGRIVGTCELVVPETPYLIPYRVRGGRLELIAVFHGRQKWPVKPQV
ncbi:MAG: type II toxin-antitoxin system RelE/ParE family toxin [Bryobacteraceae bacterium]